MKKPYAAAAPRGLLVFSSLFLTGLALEGVLRVTNPLDLNWRMVQPHPTRIAALSPNFDGTFKGIRVKTNAFGHRVPTTWEKRYPAAKPPGVMRVVVVGDSFTFGDEWPAESSFVEQLQQRLDPDALHIQVLNLGMFGYNPLQEWEVVAHDVSTFDPDVVILQFTDANDLIEVIPPDSANVLQRGWMWLRQHSYLYWAVGDVWYHGQGSRLRSRILGTAKTSSSRTSDGQAQDQAIHRILRRATRYYQRRYTSIKRHDRGWIQALESYQRIARWLAARRIPLIMVIASPNWDLECADWCCRGMTIHYRETVAAGQPFYATLAREFGALTPDALSLDTAFGPYTLEELYDGPTWHYGPTKASIIADRLLALLQHVGVTSQPHRIGHDGQQTQSPATDR